MPIPMRIGDIVLLCVRVAILVAPIIGCAWWSYVTFRKD